MYCIKAKLFLRALHFLFFLDCLNQEASKEDKRSQDLKLTFTVLSWSYHAILQNSNLACSSNWCRLAVKCIALPTTLPMSTRLSMYVVSQYIVWQRCVHCSRLCTCNDEYVNKPAFGSQSSSRLFWRFSCSMFFCSRTTFYTNFVTFLCVYPSLNIPDKF